MRLAERERLRLCERDWLCEWKALREADMLIESDRLFDFRLALTERDFHMDFDALFDSLRTMLSLRLRLMLCERD